SPALRPPPPTSSLSPYTTLFRSARVRSEESEEPATPAVHPLQRTTFPRDHRRRDVLREVLTPARAPPGGAADPALRRCDRAELLLSHGCDRAERRSARRGAAHRHGVGNLPGRARADRAPAAREVSCADLGDGERVRRQRAGRTHRPARWLARLGTLPASLPPRSPLGDGRLRVTLRAVLPLVFFG